MPELGGKQFAGEFKTLLAGVRKSIDEMKLDVVASMTELHEEIKTGHEVAKAVRGEAAAIRSATGEIFGNAAPEGNGKA